MKYATVRSESIILFSLRTENDANGAKPRPREEENGHTKESRPFSQCSMCKIFLCLSKKRNCFLEFHDDRILDPTKAAAETVLAVDPEEEIAVQTVETNPLGIYPSSDSSEDSDFDVLDNGVNDGVLLDEDEWLE